jgi:hypothetical protein
MSELWREFVDTVDTQISVKDDRFLSDLRGLIWWPVIPFLPAFIFVEPPSIGAFCLILVVVLTTMAWTWFLFHRRAVKKRSWVEPDRYADDNNGY